MLEILSDYFEEVDSVLEENPILRLEKLLDGHRNVTPGEITSVEYKNEKAMEQLCKIWIRNVHCFDRRRM